jgi:hypothetical protein
MELGRNGRKMLGISGSNQVFFFNFLKFSQSLHETERLVPRLRGTSGPFQKGFHNSRILSKNSSEFAQRVQVCPGVGNECQTQSSESWKGALVGGWRCGLNCQKNMNN